MISKCKGEKTVICPSLKRKSQEKHYIFQLYRISEFTSTVQLWKIKDYELSVFED